VLRVNDHIAKTILERAGVSVEALEQEMAEPQPPIPDSVDVPWILPDPPEPLENPDRTRIEHVEPYT